MFIVCTFPFSRSLILRFLEHFPSYSCFHYTNSNRISMENINLIFRMLLKRQHPEKYKASRISSRLCLPRLIIMLSESPAEGRKLHPVTDVSGVLIQSSCAAECEELWLGMREHWEQTANGRQTRDGERTRERTLKGKRGTERGRERGRSGANEGRGEDAVSGWKPANKEKDVVGPSASLSLSFHPAVRGQKVSVVEGFCANVLFFMTDEMTQILLEALTVLRNILFA